MALSSMASSATSFCFFSHSPDSCSSNTYTAPDLIPSTSISKWDASIAVPFSTAPDTPKSDRVCATSGCNFCPSTTSPSISSVQLHCPAKARNARPSKDLDG
eukprot:scaffold285_cov330-Pavlova_lutheri.AAC.111